MIRATNKIVDIWKCVHAFLNKKRASAPWSSWKIIKGWPESDVFTDLGSPFIFTESPIQIGYNTPQQGARRSEEFFEMKIGLWDDRKTGGIEEISILSGRVLDTFGDMYGVHTATFDVTLASAHTDTTLLEQGITIEDIRGPRNIATENPKEFRREFTLRIRA